LRVLAVFVAKKGQCRNKVRRKSGKNLPGIHFHPTFVPVKTTNKLKIKIMKKLFMILCMTLMSVGAFAEEGDVWVGVEGNYTLNHANNVGIGGKVQWECLKNVRLESNAVYFFKKDDHQFLDAQVNAHYLINLGKEDFNVYPVAGCVFRTEKFYYPANPKTGAAETTDKGNAFGMILGAGIEYPITSSVKLNTECRYIYLDYCTISVGLSVKL